MNKITWSEMTKEEKQQTKRIVMFWSITAEILESVFMTLTALFTMYLITKTYSASWLIAIAFLAAPIMYVLEKPKDDADYILKQIEKEESEEMNNENSNR